MSLQLHGDLGASAVQPGSINADDLATAAVGSAALQKMLLTAAQATTSGTSIDFTGIPSWAKKITVIVDQVSVSGTSPVQLQAVTSSGVVGNGYISLAAFCGALNAAGFARTPPV